MPYLTLKVGSTEKSFAAWGIALESCSTVTRHLATGEFRFAIPLADLPPSDDIATDDSIIVYRNRESATGAENSFSGGSIAFQGRIVAVRHAISGPSAGTAFRAANCWFDLENTLYQQKVANLLTAGGDPEFPYISNLTLFQELDDSVQPQLVPITTGTQITRILQFLLEAYTEQGLDAPFQIGTIAPALNLPAVELNKMSCADAIRKCLELHPDYVFIIGNDTSPPTIHVKKTSTITAVNLPYKALGGVNVTDFAITRRDDLVPAAVVIQYRINVLQNGFNFATYCSDKYGPHGQGSSSDPNRGLGVIVHTLDLTGSSYSAVHLRANLDCEAVMVNGSQAQRIAWWCDSRGGGRIEKPAEIAANEVKELTINDAEILDDDGNAVSLATYPYALINTPVQDWMTYNGAAVLTKNVKIVADVLWYDEQDKLHTAKFTQQLTLTNAPAGVYAFDSVDSDSGEGIPGVTSYDDNGRPIFVNGLAKQLYDALSTPQFDCDLVRVASVCPGDVTLANVINIIGGQSEWESARMTIQEITEYDGLGQTTLRLSPRPIYDANQLADLWRFDKWFRRYAAFTGRQTGEYGGSSINL